MSSVVQQVHDSFKSFVGSDIGSISASISEFVTSNGHAAKSVGIVHVGSANELLFSLGYRDDEPGYPVALKAVSLGHVDTLHSAGVDALDEALDNAAAGDFTVVFLIHAA